MHTHTHRAHMWYPAMVSAAHRSYHPVSLQIIALPKPCMLGRPWLYQCLAHTPQSLDMAQECR